MKVIAENKIASVSANYENANKPASNVLNNSINRVWESTVNSGVLSCTLSSSSGETAALLIANTNADYVICNISDPNALYWPDDEWDGLDFVYADVDSTITEVQYGGSKSFWIEWENVGVALAIDLVFSASDTLYAGVVFGGVYQQFTDPEYGLTMKPASNAITKTLSNGAFWGKKRNYPMRQFSGQITLERDSAFFDFIDMACEADIVDPCAFRVTELNGNEWAVFARFVDLPGGSHRYFRHTPTTFTLLEAL